MILHYLLLLIRILMKQIHQKETKNILTAKNIAIMRMLLISLAQG